MICQSWVVECKFLLISKFSAPCFERSWNTFVQKYSPMRVVQMVWPVTTINKWDQGGSRYPFWQAFFQAICWVQEAGMGCSFYIGNFKKCNSGFAIFSWVTTILGLFATVTPKSVHESVWWLCEWAGIRFCLKNSLFLGLGPYLLGYHFQICINCVTHFFCSRNTWLSWALTSVPMLCGYLLWGGLQFQF